MSSAPWLATLLILGTGCRAATPCRGARFDADAPHPQCLVRYDMNAAMPIEAIAVRLEGPPLTVASGGTVSFVLALENITEAPLDMPVPGGPGNDQARDYHRWSTPLKVLP